MQRLTVCAGMESRDNEFACAKQVLRQESIGQRNLQDHRPGGDRLCKTKGEVLVPDSHVMATILIVDDTPTNLALMVELLRPHYRTRVATNGDKAISRAEFDAATQARFAKADTNNDGSITQAERTAAREAMRAQRAERNAAAAPAN